MDKLKIIIIADNTNWGLVKDCITTLNNTYPEVSIVVANNGTPLFKEDLLSDSLDRQFLFNEFMDFSAPTPYGKVVNDVLSAIGDKSDVILLNPGVRCTVDSLFALTDITNSIKHIAIVSGGKTTGQVITATKGAVLITRTALFYNLNPFSNKIITEEMSMIDVSLTYVHGDKLITYEVPFEHTFVSLGEDKNLEANLEHDRLIMEKDIWGMKYFNTEPNPHIINCIKEPKDKEFTVMEFGCDLGANLLGIKKKYPKARLRGIEYNEVATNIARSIADVQMLNIDDLNVYDFQCMHKVDYIIFGDVLEHLRNPEEVVKNCKYMLKDGGKIIASIPNLMHISVVKELFNGRFEYTDRGLLDRTHIHFFTKKEIGAMFYNAGYDVNITSLETAVSRDDMNLISALMKLGMATRSEYTTFQYLCVATPKQ